MHLNCLRQTLIFTEREYFSLGVNILTNRLKVSHTNETKLFELISFQRYQKNMTKILPRRFKRSFAPFNILTVHKCSETRLFRSVSNPVFFDSITTYEAHLFFKSIAILCRFQKWRKKLGKYFLILT